MFGALRWKEFYQPRCSVYFHWNWSKHVLGAVRLGVFPLELGSFHTSSKFINHYYVTPIMFFVAICVTITLFLLCFRPRFRLPIFAVLVLLWIGGYLSPTPLNFDKVIISKSFPAQNVIERHFLYGKMVDLVEDLRSFVYLQKDINNQLIDCIFDDFVFDGMLSYYDSALKEQGTFSGYRLFDPNEKELVILIGNLHEYVAAGYLFEIHPKTTIRWTSKTLNASKEVIDVDMEVYNAYNRGHENNKEFETCYIQLHSPSLYCQIRNYITESFVGIHKRHDIQKITISGHTYGGALVPLLLLILQSS